MPAGPRVLFIGVDRYGSNATSLRNAIVRHGHDCLTIPMWEPDLLIRVARRAGGATTRLHRAQALWNRNVVEVAAGWKPDITVVFKGLSLDATTLAQLPGTTVHYHPDDSTNQYNRSPAYDMAEARYDLHVTTKTVNVDELRSRGAANVLFVRCAYDRDWHVPAHRSAGPKYAVGFIGVRRPDRVELMRDVARRIRKQFLICGAKWRRDLFLRRTATVSGPRFGFDMAQAISEAPVQLGLLNSYNRDRHTCRSYEVPASGGLLLAERTDEHSEMLEDGREALFFSGEEELFSQLDRIRREPALATRVREAGCLRIRSGGNTYEDRWAEITKHLGVS